MRRWIVTTLILTLIFGFGVYAFESDLEKIKKERNLPTLGEHYFSTLVVDSFEKKDGETWNIRFSRNRAPTWYGNSNIITPTYEPDSSWMSYITANGTSIKRIKILPPSVYLADREKKYKTVLFVKGRWKTKGYNWLEINPTKPRVMREAGDKEQFEKTEFYKRRPKIEPYIQLVGEVKTVSVWVWGMGCNSTISLWILDHEDIKHEIHGGRINHFGWKQIFFEIPKNITQFVLGKWPISRPIRLTGIRIYIDPNENPDYCYYYLDHITCVTDVNPYPFFGDFLVYPSRLLRR